MVRRAVALSASERAEFLRCHREASDQYQRYRHGGVECIKRHIMSLLGLLHPLRLLCSGGALRPVVRSQAANHGWVQGSGFRRGAICS